MDKRRVIISSIAAVIIVIAAVAYLFASNMATEWLKTSGVALLQEKLQTRVVVADLDLRLFDGKVSVYGFEVDDREKVCMLKVDTLEVNTDVLALLRKELVLEEMNLHGAEMVAYKNSKDSAANYQFVLDAFATKDKKKDKDAASSRKKKNDIQLRLKRLSLNNVSLVWDVKSEPMKGGDTLDVNHLKASVRSLMMKGMIGGSRVTDFTVSNANMVEEKSHVSFTLGNGQCRTMADRHLTARLEKIAFAYQDKRVGVDCLSLWHNKLSIHPELSVRIDSLRYFCDNGKPRKNAGRPNRGAFDKGHMDAVLNIDAVLTSFSKDSIEGRIRKLWAKDKASGLLVTDLHTDFLVSSSTSNGSSSAGEGNGKDRVIDFKNLQLRMPLSHLNINNARVRLEKRPAGMKPKTQVVIEPLHVSGCVGLQDIAEPFAPVLSNFTTPLNLDVDAHGDLDRIQFNNIRITSKGQHLRLTADGDLCDVTKKKYLSLHFNNIHLSTHGGMKEKIIGHFRHKVNMKMERQMRAIGDVDFAGRLTIIYKKELIAGTLFTKFGNVDVDFEVNGFTRYLTGTMHGRRVDIGKVMNVERLGPVSAAANYSFNIASKKKLSELGKNPGKLPIGTLQANIEEVSYKKLSFRNIAVHIKSNGTIADGEVRTSLRLFDIQALFQYKQTAHEQSYKIKPRIVKHLPSLAQQAEKKRKEEEKAEAKAARRAEKEAKRQERNSLFSKIREHIADIKDKQ